MKKALFAVVVLAILVWVATWFRAPGAVAASAAQSWPGGLGSLAAVESRYPAVPANDASKTIAAFVRAVANREALESYVGRELERGDLTIGEPPALPEVTPLRDLLLRSEVVWGRPGGVGDIGGQEVSDARGVQMTAARVLIANALKRARANDPASWDDLHALWKLAESLNGQPQVTTQTAALSMRRMLNAVAWRLPLPAPAWFAEVQNRDALPRLLEAFQYQAASYWESGSGMFPTKWLADAVEHDRRIAEALVRETRCDANVQMNELGVDLSDVWHRAFRYRAEREATANALRLRAGEQISAASRCAGGAWSFDGGTLRFNREIPAGERDHAMPLVLRIGT
jgi:hypothetical protein